MIKASPLFLGLVVLAANGCFFATKQDIDRLQADIVGTRVSSGAADSVQRAQLIELSRSVKTLNDSISALSKRMAAMRTATESDMTAMRENISQLQDLSGQSEQRLRDVRAAL
jgi:outer membrane murein-binding lipoprotein Lpp